jgi:hypothetical protein
MTKRRDRGDGGIDKRGEDAWRLRYRIKGQRYSVTFHGTLQEARKRLRALLRSGDTGEHVAPDKITVGQWSEQWLAGGAPGKLRKPVGARSLDRYSEQMRLHVVPTLGTRPLQQLQATEIDALYRRLESKLAPRTAHQVHSVLGACLGTALRKGLLTTNPLTRVERIPSPGEADHGTVLDQEQLRTLVEGFRGLSCFPSSAWPHLPALVAMKSSRCAGPTWTTGPKRCASSGQSTWFTGGRLDLRLQKLSAASARLPSMTISSRCSPPSARGIAALRPACLTVPRSR